MSAKPDVRILMATYNGSRWLDEQLESLFQQDFTDWRLVVRDDGSQDTTPKILQKWAERHSDKMTWYTDRRRLGPAGSFSDLVFRNSMADYLFFCDQDDVWAPEKLRITLGVLREMEAVQGSEIPLLVHHDLTVCNGSLIPIADSFWDFQALDPVKNTLPRLLLQNVVTGCATGINRSLAQKAGAIPPEAIMHDWWLALVAATFGHIQPIRMPNLIRYRIHGDNACGTTERALSWSYIRKRLFQRGGPSLHARLQPYYRQAAAFQENFHDELTSEQRTMLEAFVGLPGKSWFERRVLILKYGFWKQEWIRNLAWLLRA